MLWEYARRLGYHWNQAQYVLSNKMQWKIVKRLHVSQINYNQWINVLKLNLGLTEIGYSHTMLQSPIFPIVWRHSLGVCPIHRQTQIFYGHIYIILYIIYIYIIIYINLYIIYILNYIYIHIYISGLYLFCLFHIPWNYTISWKIPLYWWLSHIFLVVYWPIEIDPQAASDASHGKYAWVSGISQRPAMWDCWPEISHQMRIFR